MGLDSELTLTYKYFRAINNALYVLQGSHILRAQKTNLSSFSNKQKKESISILVLVFQAENQEKLQNKG